MDLFSFFSNLFTSNTIKKMSSIPSVNQLKTLGLKITDAELIELSNGLSVVAEKFKINTPLRIKHFLAQCLHETGGATIKVERSNGDPYAYFENKYGFKTLTGKNNLGNKLVGDGYKFRGRGLIQLTGRENYTALSRYLFGDERLTTNPDWVSASFTNSALSAGWYWYFHLKSATYPEGRCNYFADKNDIVNLTKAVNGGSNGLAERKVWFTRITNWYSLLPSAVAGIGIGLIGIAFLFLFLKYK